MKKKKGNKELGIAVIGTGNDVGRAYLVDLQNLKDPSVPIEDTIKKIPEGIQFYIPPQLPILIPISMDQKEK